MNRNLCAALLALFFLTAQSFAGGPIYSRYGIGELAYIGGTRSFGMGGTAVGLFGDGFINQINPAGLAGLTVTRFAGLFEFSNYSSTDGINSGRYARGDFGGLSIAIPVAKDYGVVIIGDMSPYSSVNYASHNNTTQLGIASSQQYYGSGGLLRFDFGSSVSITNTLHAGFKLNYLAGTILHNTKIEFQDNSYANTGIDRRFFYSGLMFTFGAIYDGFSDLFGVTALKPLTVGVVLETPTTLEGRQQNFTSTAQDYDTTLTQNGTADIPLLLAVGASYAFSQRYVLSADLAMQNWSNAKNFGVHPPEYRNRIRFGAGIEVLPAKDAASYWGHVIYRAGFYYNSTYLQVQGPLNSGAYEPINGIFGTVGVGLPIGPDSHLNIGLQYGVNGTMANGLQKDNILRLSVSVSGSELWFMRYEED